MTTRTPALFIGHGSPENAVLDNAFTQHLQSIGQRLAKPRAILAISAHWLTQGSLITSAENPEQIFDFYGFPNALYQVRYPAHTDATVVQEILQLGSAIPILADDQAGFDHGTWTVLKHIWPEADIPVIQLSLDTRRNRLQHWQLAQQLQALRARGVMIIASGNIVHNLRLINWQQRYGASDWAIRFDEDIKNALLTNNTQRLTQGRHLMTPEEKLAVPSEDHYWPLLYVAGVRHAEDELTWLYEGYEYGSISLRSFMLA